MSNLINYWQHIDVFIYAEKEHKPSNPIPFYTSEISINYRIGGGCVCECVWKSSFTQPAADDRTNSERKNLEEIATARLKRTIEENKITTVALSTPPPPSTKKRHNCTPGLCFMHKAQFRDPGHYLNNYP